MVMLPFPARIFALAAPLLLAAPSTAQTILPSGTSSGIPAPSATDPVEALGRYLRVLATFPKNLDALTGAGNAALAIGDANAAISFFARAEEIAPRDGRIKAGLASALVQVEQPRTALKLFDRAVDLGVPEAEIAGDRGLAFDLRGDSRRAQTEYARALAWRADDEITRRLAVSQAISGDRAGAMATLDALLRRQDRAAWRIRAFVLALTGDSAGAREAALAVMPRDQAEALSPYFSRLVALKPEQKAAAVHLGQFPADGRAAVPNQPVYAVADASPPSVPSSSPRSDVPLIPARTALGTRTLLADAGGPVSLAPRRRPGGETLVPPAGGPAPAVELAAASPTVAPQPRAEPVAPPPAVPSPPVQPPTAADVAAVGATSTRPIASATAATPGFSEPLAPRALASPSSVERAGPAPLSPAVQDAAAPPAAFPPSPEAPVRVAANSVTVPLDAPSRPASPVPAAVKPKDAPKPPSTAKPSAEAKEPATKDKNEARNTTKLATVDSKIAGREAKAADTRKAKPEAAAAKDKPDAKANAKGKGDAKTAAKDKADAKTAAKDKADAKTAAKDKDKLDAKTADKAAKDKAPAGERYWVQVASGANKTDLGRAWEKTKAKAPKLLDGRATWTAPWKASNRLLVGPFKSEDEAQVFVNSLGKAGMGGIQFTSRGGARVERLATK